MTKEIIFSTPRKWIPSTFHFEYNDGCLKVIIGESLRDRAWAAYFGQIQQALYNKCWKGSNPVDKCLYDLSKCTWADPLPLLYLILSAFDLTENSSLKKLSHRLAYGALLFTKEKSIAYVSAKKPDIYLRRLASKMKKRLIWIPISSFSSETLRRLRRFHILNGKQVRSWASRFIGE